MNLEDRHVSKRTLYVEVKWVKKTTAQQQGAQEASDSYAKKPVGGGMEPTQSFQSNQDGGSEQGQ
jgi:hypothetical protein